MARALVAIALVFVLARSARADAEGITPGPQTEPIDVTRLDVARLPPEAARPARALFARGWFAEAQLGARTFAGDARAVSRAGPRLALALGYEVTRWLALSLALDASMHGTRGPTPPARTSYELLGATLGVRFTAPIGAQAGLWAGGLVGLAWSSADVLRARGFRAADNVRPSYGGEVGFDWHLLSRHHSVGVLSGALLYPGLQERGFTVGAHGAAYLRYVF